MKIKDDRFHEIKQFCIDRRIKGLSVNEIVAVLNKKGIKDWDYHRVKNAARVSRNPDISSAVKTRNKNAKQERQEIVKEGATERKPKYELIDGFYTIFYGKNKKLKISECDVDKAFKLYTLGNLTMNQVALDIGISRAEFYALKTAFSLTKTDLPFTPEKIDEMSADEIAEQIRIEKKRLALKKFAKNKHADIESEVKRLHKAEFWADEFAKKINAIDPKPYDVKATKENDDVERMLIATDFHAGLEVTNFLGEYSIGIMKKRFIDITEQIIRKIKPCRLTIALLGDDVHAPPHDSCGKQSLNAVDSIFHLVESLSSMFLTLIQRGFRLRIAHTPGNHDYITRGTARVNEESFARFTAWGLRCKFAHFPQVEFIESINNMALISFFDYSVLACHGHQTKKLSNFDKLLRRHNLIEIVAGHYHCYRVESMDNVPVYYNNAFCSGDEYAANLGLGSEPGCRLVEYGKKGRISDTLLRFDC